MTKPTVKKIKGKVIKGLGEGKRLGIPTANIQTNQDLSSLEQGVYAVLVYLDDTEYKGVAHYGPRLVFDEEKPEFEVHLFDFDDDIYDKELVVEIVEFIRPTMKFDDVKKMLEQIEIDKVNAIKNLV